MFESFQALCALPGPSGAEDAVRDYLRSQAAPYADEILTDPMGNLMVFRKGRLYRQAHYGRRHAEIRLCRRR